jgi:hypothetical protein
MISFGIFRPHFISRQVDAIAPEDVALNVGQPQPSPKVLPHRGEQRVWWEADWRNQGKHQKQAGNACLRS